MDPNIQPDTLPKAEHGDPYAQIEVGKLYLDSTIKDNYDFAQSWISLAASQGLMEAQFLLGDINALHGKSHKSFECYTKSAIQGYPSALQRLAKLYQDDEMMLCRGQLTSSEAVWDNRRFRKEHHIRELNEYRSQFIESIVPGLVNYFTDKFQQYKNHQHQDGEVMLNLGFLYHHGFGTKRNHARAIECYTIAAKEGYTDAQYNLGCLYYIHHDIKFHYRLAFTYFEAASDKNSCAQFYLAIMYEKGFGCDLSHAKAYEYYLKSATQQNTQAELSLAKIHRKRATYQDTQKAIYWYTLAANRGSKVAQNCLHLLEITNKIQHDLIQKYTSEPAIKTRLCSRLRQDVLNIKENGPSVDTLKKLAGYCMVGQATAMHTLSQIYYQGTHGLSQNTDIAFEWLRKAAKGGSSNAQYELASVYEHGEMDIDQNYYKASIWYERASNQNHVDAQVSLGLLYYYGLGVRKDPLEASKYYTIAAERTNHHHAQCQLGLLRWRGRGLRKDFVEAVDWFTKSAKQGNLQAIYLLGKMYHLGKGVKKNRHRASQFYEYAASQGNLDAQITLGKRFYKEDEESLAKSFRFYAAAASQNHTESKYMLGLMYLKGRGTEKDYLLAYEMLKEAASSNDDDCDAKYIFETPITHIDISYYQDILDMFMLVHENNMDDLEYNIGYIYENGIPYATAKHRASSIDFPKAIQFYYLAAEKGDTRAFLKLGTIYEQGKKINQNLDSAIKYYRLASENRDGEATFRLANMYREGRGVLQDVNKAFSLYRQAAIDLGHINSKELLTLSNRSDTNTDVDILNMLETVAENGNVPIQYQLGILYQAKNATKAIHWFTLAAYYGDVIDAYYRLGVLYEESINDYEKAIYSYEKAIEKDEENAMFRLARMYHYGKGIQCDYGKAFELYTKAATLGNMPAKKVLNITALKRRDDETILEESNDNVSFDTESKEFKDSLDMYEYVAEKGGDSEVQFKVGSVYEKILPDYSKAVKWYTLSAAQLHKNATYRLGKLYEKGRGVSQFYETALELYKKAREQGNDDATFRIGIMYQFGRGTAGIDYHLALKYYLEAGEKRNIKAQYKLGMIYRNGDIVESNMVEALKWYTRSYTQGSEIAAGPLRAMYEKPFSRSSFYKKWFSILLCFKNHILLVNDNRHRLIYGRVFHNLGYFYFYGYGTNEENDEKKNYLEAFDSFSIAYKKYKYEPSHPFLNLAYEPDGSFGSDFYNKKLEMFDTAIDQLENETQFDLALIYYNGIKTTIACTIDPFEMMNWNDTKENMIGQNEKQVTIVQQDFAKAFNYFNKITEDEFHQKKMNAILKKDNNNSITEMKKLTDREYTNASFTLGLFYDKKSISDEGYSKAVHYFKIAAERGHDEAQYYLGSLYKKRYGINGEESESFKWFKKSADQDNEEACYTLGVVYYQGDCVKMDKKIAFHYFTIAAEQGHRQAQKYLGGIYKHGLGTEADISKSVMYYTKASNQGNDYSTITLGKMHHADPECPRHFIKAHELYKKVIGYRNKKHAIRGIGLLFEYGDGCDQDLDKAFECYTASANMKNRATYYDLARLYFHGKGVTQDYKQAFKWFLRATRKAPSSAGVYVYIKDSRNETRSYSLVPFTFIYGDACHYLGIMYENGYGVVRNHAEAVRYLLISSDNKKEIVESLPELEELE